MLSFLQVLSDNTYKFTLDIAVVDKSEVSNQHTLTITTKGIKKKIEFFLSLKMQQVFKILKNDFYFMDKDTQKITI